MSAPPWVMAKASRLAITKNITVRQALAELGKRGGKKAATVRRQPVQTTFKFNKSQPHP